MSLLGSRAVLRQSAKQLTGRTAKRFESTTAKATEAAKETASKASEKAADYKSKASEGLSKVTSSAGPAISGAAKSVGNALGRIGGRTGRLISFVERQIPPAIYYSRVGLELTKLVFQGQKMSPPPVSTFQSYFQRVVKGVSNPSSLLAQAPSASNATPSNILNRVRNIDSTQLAAGGVILAECIGFFTVGEIIGRFKLVGYKGEKEAHH